MRKRWLLGFVTLLNSTMVFAGNTPGAVTITAADAYYHYDHKRNLDNSAFPNLAIAYDFSQHWAIEAAAGILNSQQDAGTSDSKSVHGVLYSFDGIYRFTPYGHFEPYILGGVGLLDMYANDTDNSHPGNINLGIGTQLFWGPTIAMRMEARDVYQTTGKNYNDYMFNFGVSFLFGGS